jgi:cellulose synthase/poly-beta-1,6-N-acetylglucosamine synthase-like glycosyltransferase
LTPYSIADSHIAGPLIPLRPKTVVSVKHRTVLTGRDRLTVLAFAGLLVTATVGSWTFALKHLQFSDLAWQRALGVIALLAFGMTDGLRVIQGAFLMGCTWLAKNPVPLSPQPGLRVAVLTTIVPSKEPLSIVARTLRAMKQIRYPSGTVDVWILDEGDDDDVKAVAAELGVKHFTRKHNPPAQYGPKTKAGNHNAWRAKHEREYDIVAQMDPDHTPFPNFLERTLGYFRDPNVGFVVAPQVYGNLNDCFVAKGAAEHAYIFHGIVQRAGSMIGSPILIGTNHLYRTTTLKQIGGYQNSIIEDHKTSITVHASRNPATGARWKGVYTPDVLSIGEGPASWNDYFAQQERWAYGVTEILFKTTPRLLPSLPWRTALFYLGTELFYPGLALTFLVSLFLCLTTTAFGADTPVFLHGRMWGFAALWALGLVAQIGFFVWMQRFNLTESERTGASKTAMLLTLLTAPVYASAVAKLLRGRRLGYVVTPKGVARTSERLSTFGPHLAGAAVYLPILLVAAMTSNGNATFWSTFTLIPLITLPLVVLWPTANEPLRSARMKTIRASGLTLFFALVAFVVPARAQTLYFPGSVWTTNGTLTPVEPGNKTTLTQFQQGLALKGAEVFATLTAEHDTAGYDWNRRVIQGGGARYTLSLPGGYIRPTVAYLSDKRFVVPRSMNGWSLTVDAWFGWQQRAPQPPSVPVAARELR